MQQNLFLSVMFIAMFQVVMHSTRNMDIAATKSLIKRKLIPPRDQFEERNFHAWSIKLSKDIIGDPLFFGDKFKLLRLSFELEYALCNSTYHYPKQVSPNSRLKLKGYDENVCPWDIGQIANQVPGDYQANSPLSDDSVKKYLKDKYGLLAATGSFEYRRL